MCLLKEANKNKCKKYGKLDEKFLQKYFFEFQFADCTVEGLKM